MIMVVMNAPALAFDCGEPQDPDPTVISASLVALAVELRCTPLPGTDAEPGTWPRDTPIWEKRREGSCDIHESLARKLNEDRDFDEGSKPPRNKNNTATGAANDVANGKYLGAVDKLDAFVNDVYKSRLNTDFGSATAAKMYFLGQVEEARMCVCKLTECE